MFNLLLNRRNCWRSVEKEVIVFVDDQKSRITVVFIMILRDIGRNLFNNFFIFIHFNVKLRDWFAHHSGYSELYCGSAAAENRVERSGAVSGRCRKRWSVSGRSAEREVTERERSGGYRNRLERVPYFIMCDFCLVWLSLFGFLEALRNALYKCSTYLLTYFFV